MKPDQILTVASGEEDINFNSLCPWQEIRLLPHLHYQIDLILTPDELYKLDVNDAYMDLQRMYLYPGKESTYTLSKKFEYIKYHNAVQPQPMYAHWKYVNVLPGRALDPTKIVTEIDGVTYYGFGYQREWSARRVDKGIDIMVAMRELKTRIHLSYAIILTKK